LRDTQFLTQENQMNDHEPVIVGALRTPVGKRGGRLHKWHPVDLMAETLRQLVERSGVNPADLDDVIIGWGLPG